MYSLETVKVKNPADPDGGFMIINRSDFDKSKHELHPDNGALVEIPETEAQRAQRFKEIERQYESKRGVTTGTPIGPGQEGR